MEIKKKRRFHVSRTSWGAQAERKVQRILEGLPMDHFIVMNDVRFKYGNIDHLVVRDDGTVFLVETKSHRGRVTTDGQQLLLNGRPFKKNYLCQINRNIRWLRSMAKKVFGLNRWYVAIIVFPNAHVFGKTSAKRVNTVAADRLISFIRSYSR